MGWFDGFPFKTKEQMERERKEFESRVFPLGPEQKDIALAILKQLLVRPKLKDNEKLYAYISAKDKYAYHGDDGGVEYAQSALRKQKWLNEEEIRLVLALVMLDTKATSLEEYPSIEEIQVLGRTLAGM